MIKAEITANELEIIENLSEAMLVSRRTYKTLFSNLEEQRAAATALVNMVDRIQGKLIEDRIFSSRDQAKGGRYE